MLTLIQQNHSLIDQAIDLIAKISPAVYRKSCELVFSSSISQHIRHCIEHYDELFMAHAENRAVHYHERPRNAEIETDPAIAINRLRFIRNQLDRLSCKDEALKVADSGITEPAASSVSRELEFLVSHTLHHFALIAIVASQFEMKVPENFGIAPSTLKYRESA